jgi:predicted nucleic acid-binding protein
LDTNSVSAIADGDGDIDPILRGADEIAIPVIVLGEYRYGTSQSRHRRRYDEFLRALVANSRVLSIDETTAGEYASIRGELKRAGRPIPANDVWIAALARQHAMPLVSRDKHFDSVPNLKRVAW